MIRQNSGVYEVYEQNMNERNLKSNNIRTAANIPHEYDDYLKPERNSFMQQIAKKKFHITIVFLIIVILILLGFLLIVEQPQLCECETTIAAKPTVSTSTSSISTTTAGYCLILVSQILIFHLQVQT